jgi:O-antigen/teichoic acid export membrane protein
MQGLAVAVFVNSIGQAGYAALQAGGRADVAGKLHVVELPVYFALLYVLLSKYGLLGVALAWAVRMIGDTALQLWLAGRLFPALRAASRRSLVIVGVASTALVACTAATQLAARITLAALLLPATFYVAWTRLVTEDERARCAALVRRLALRADDGEMPAV